MFFGKNTEKLRSDFGEEFTKMVTENLNAQHKAKSDFILHHLRNTIDPPIEGEITQEKISEREITYGERYDPSTGTVYSWLNEKGKRVTPEFETTHWKTGLK